jgi:hypothetical protein
MESNVAVKAPQPLGLLHGKTDPKPQPSELNPTPLLVPTAKRSKFQRAPVGIIYEEISLIDSMDDETYGCLLA